MKELMKEVHIYLRRRDKSLQRLYTKKQAA
jgi:hypothetical protein